jgi:CheY-like chemotaxis protein
MLTELRSTSGERARETLGILAFEAHALRGAAATVELADLAAHASALEESIARWSPGSADALDAVVEECEALLEQLRSVVHANARGSPDVPETDTPRSSSHALVLHIEDNMSNLKLVERILERRPGVALCEARTGAEGLALAVRLRPSLILLDLRLPDMSGEDVLRRLHEDEATREIPVVVVSAEARPAEADRVLAAGADDFLVKPIDVQTLLELVDRILARARR